MKGDRTEAQQNRQKYRGRDGRYAETYHCYLCNKVVGEDYFSDRRTDTTDLEGNDWGDVALCLCERCSKGLDRLPDGLAFKVACGQLPRPWARRRKVA